MSTVGRDYRLLPRLGLQVVEARPRPGEPLSAAEHRPSPEALVCHQCRLVYPVEDGIPIMLIDEAKPL